MTLIKKFSASVLAITSITLLYLLLFKKELTILSVSNSFFMIGIVFLMIAAFIGIFISGFFDNFQANLKAALARRKSNEPKDYIKTSEIFSKQPIYWLSVAAFYLIIAVLLLFFIQ